MTPELRITTRAAALSREKQQALLRMQSHFRPDTDLLSPSEIIRLRFVRWLYQTRRLTDTPDCTSGTGREVAMITR